MSKKERLLVIVGPTAVGKTALSIDLAKKFHGEIISGDSAQVYRGMDIGTAKITAEEMDGVPHHLINTHEPDEPFSVAEFQQKATKLIHDIDQRAGLAMIVGGTGLYIQSVIYDYQFSEATGDVSYRQKMEQLAQVEGNVALHGCLAEVDPITAKRLHPNDLKRIIRALEIYKTTGKTMAEHQRRTMESPYQLALIGLTIEREKLYERINNRVDGMIQDGLVEEVQSLLQKGYSPQLPSMRAIGYKEIVAYLQGNLTLPEAIEWLKKNTRHYAKRQLTWFRSMKDICWYDLTNPRSRAEIVENIQQDLEGILY